MSQPAPAAAADDELAALADALDVDDSDLLRRGPAASLSPLRTSSAAPRPEGRPGSAAAPRRVPSPAASLAQDAARLRSPLLRSTARGDGFQAADPDFSLPPWLHALGSLGESGGRGEGRVWKRQEIAAILGDRALYRARLVVGMVMSCTPNRLGDLFLSLKDPSGTIGASVHQKVFTKEDGMVVSVGSVIVLKKVAVFRPSNKACYLNITKENLELLVPKDFGLPSKQVVPSSISESQHSVKCADTMNSSCQGDNHIRRTGADTYEETTENDVRVSTQGVENHQDMRLEEKDINPLNKNMPSYSTNQQSQKTINSISPANCQQRRGSPFKYASSKAENSTNDIMMRLLGGERTAPNNKKTAVTEVFCDHAGTPDANNNTSRMDSDFSNSSGKHHGIEHQTLMERLGSRHILNYNGKEHHQQCLDVSENPNTRCSQPSLGGGSLMSKTGDSIEASSDEKPNRPVEGEWMLPSSKKRRSDAVLLDNVISSMNTETYGLANNLNMGLDDVARGIHGIETWVSIKKPNDCQQKDITTETLGSALPTQENISVATGDATTVPASLQSQPNKMVSVASVTEWTDDQLSELFLDY
uniref:Homologous recombination OB-fold protein OB-fold domain-containing protein n=1 Tax=Leersia perrieri TaxID=77586 RepID=A0A0D9WXE0_9ORYZ